MLFINPHKTNFCFFWFFRYMMYWDLLFFATKLMKKFLMLVMLKKTELFLGGAPTSICYFFHLSVCLRPSVMHGISGTLQHMIMIFGTLSKMMISSDVFFKFFYFLILIFLAVRRVKGQKIAQNEKQLHLSCFLVWFLVHYCKMMISQAFFNFFLILISWAVSKVKGQKIVQNEK